MNVSSWSIRNPTPAILFFLLLTLAGLMGFKGMKIQQFMDIELPTVTVTATLPGAAPAQMETEVARKIENSVATLQGIKHIYTKVQDGTAIVTVEFRLEKPTQEALDDVRDAVSRIRADLPGDLKDPVVSKVNLSGAPILTYTVASPRMDDEALSWFVDNTVSKALLSARGVGAVSRVGGVTREIRIELDPARMLALNATAADISRQLRRIQQEASGGKSDIGGVEQSVRTLATVRSADELGGMDIVLSDGRRIRLDQVAKVSDTVGERRTAALLNGKPVVGFEVTRSKGAGEIEVRDAVLVALDKLKAEHPDIEITEAFNFVDPVVENYEGSMKLLIEGALLAVLVVWLFLRDGRATFVSAAALPLSAIPTFWFMEMMGFSLNGLSLLALSLVAGVLVDDAIVEIENIVRHMRMGKTAYQASIDAADEIGLAVVATTMSIVAVFLPVALMPGVSGQFFIQFGMTVVFAVLMSLAVARMITPMIAAYFLSAQGEQDHANGPWIDRYERLLAFTLDSSKQKVVKARYEVFSTRLIYFLVPAIVAGLAVIGLTFQYFQPVPVGQDAPNPALHFLLMTPLSAIVAFLVTSLLMILGGALAYALGMRDFAFTNWAKFMLQRAYARLFDHRVWIVGIGVAAFISSLVLFGVLPQQFQPTTNSDYSQIRYELPPGSTLAQSETIADQINAILRDDPVVENAFYDVEVGGGNAFLTLKKDRPISSVEWERSLQPQMAAIPDARVSFQSQSGGFSGR
ncbi:MAG: efflux RND transporter permease subunit, partial [Dechloromonas sp.]|nr:efflux RND transporter permease subunit [Dechloromonas sp.]